MNWNHNRNTAMRNLEAFRESSPSWSSISYWRFKICSQNKLNDRGETSHCLLKYFNVFMSIYNSLWVCWDFRFERKAEQVISYLKIIVVTPPAGLLKLSLEVYSSPSLTCIRMDLIDLSQPMVLDLHIQNLSCVIWLWPCLLGL